MYDGVLVEFRYSKPKVLEPLKWGWRVIFIERFRIFRVSNLFWPAKGLPYLITQSIGYGNEQF